MTEQFKRTRKCTSQNHFKKRKKEKKTQYSQFCNTKKKEKQKTLRETEKKFERKNEKKKKKKQRIPWDRTTTQRYRGLLVCRLLRNNIYYVCIYIYIYDIYH